MPSASRRFSIRRKGHHGLNHDVGIDAAFGQPQLATAEFLEVKLSQAFGTSEIALSVMRDSVGGEEISKIGPETQLRVMRVAILKALDVTKGSRAMKVVLKLRDSKLDCSKAVAGHDLSRRLHHKERHDSDDRQDGHRLHGAMDHWGIIGGVSDVDELIPLDVAERNVELSRIVQSLTPSVDRQAMTAPGGQVYLTPRDGYGEMTHQFDPAMLPDSDFVGGTLVHLVVGNSGRMLDPRRTPIRIVGFDSLTGTFFCEVLAFEDRGVRWQLPYESVASFQFSKDCVLAGPADVEEFHLAVLRFDRPLEIEMDRSARERTVARVAEARRAATAWVDEHLRFDEGDALDLSRPVGDSRIWQTCEAYFRAKGLWEIEDKFATQYVSNPHSGEFVKGHRIVLAELGLAEYRDRILRDERTLAGAWSSRVTTSDGGNRRPDTS